MQRDSSVAVSWYNQSVSCAAAVAANSIDLPDWAGRCNASTEKATAAAYFCLLFPAVVAYSPGMDLHMDLQT